MSAADFAAMSDPERNPKFSRRWEEAVARDFRGGAEQPTGTPLPRRHPPFLPGAGRPLALTLAAGRRGEAGTRRVFDLRGPAVVADHR